MADETLVADAPLTTEAAPAPSWRDTLPEDLKADKSLESFKDVGALAKSYVETKKLVGVKQDGALKVPGPEATPEERQAFAKALGVPATPAEYKVKAHEMMGHPEWNPAAQAAFLQLAHQHAMTPAQVNAAIGWYADFIGQSARDNQRIETEAKVELRTAWGPNYEPYLGAANRGMNRVAEALGVSRDEVFEATKGSDPALVAKIFHWTESQFLEHGFVQGPAIEGVSADGAQSKIAELQAELSKVPQGSAEALAIIDRIAAYGRLAARRAA